MDNIRQAGWAIVEALGDTAESNALVAFLNSASDTTLSRFEADILAGQSVGDYVLVPREPTEAMIEAAASFGGLGGYSRSRGETAVETWHEMLAAATSGRG